MEPNEETAQEQPESSQTSEKDDLIAEKQRLAAEIGIWGEHSPVPDYEATPQYARIKAINQRLAEIG